MSLASRREYLQTVKKRYLKATYDKKSGLLDECCKNTNLNRKYVIRCLSAAVSLIKKTTTTRKRRSCTYTNNEVFYLKKIWEILDYPCGQRLQPMMKEMVAKLRFFKELIVPDEAAAKLLKISSATIDIKMNYPAAS